MTAVKEMSHRCVATRKFDGDKSFLPSNMEVCVKLALASGGCR